MLEIRGLRRGNDRRRLGDAPAGFLREEPPHQREAESQYRDRRRGKHGDLLSGPARRRRNAGCRDFVPGDEARGIDPRVRFLAPVNTCVAQRFDPAYGRQQTVAALGDGLEITGRVAVVAERLAQLRDRLRHDIVARQRARPHPFEDRDPAHHLALVRHQHEQDLQRLHRDPPRSRGTGFVDVATRDVHDAIADLEEVGFGFDQVFMLVQHAASMPFTDAIVLVNTLHERRSAALGNFGKVPGHFFKQIYVAKSIP